jgi:hypothetical protein
MSVAAAADDTALFSWVGIIMYLPTEDPKERKGITDAFFGYRHACEDALWYAGYSLSEFTLDTLCTCAVAHC